MGIVRPSMVRAMWNKLDRRTKQKDRDYLKKFAFKTQFVLTPPPYDEHFQYFGKVPTELRQMTWKAAIMPQVTTIRLHPATNNLHIEYRVPVLMRTTIESRDAAASSYRLCFRDYLKYRNIQFNCRVDVLHFDNEDALVKWRRNMPWDRLLRQAYPLTDGTMFYNDSYLFERCLQHMSFGQTPHYALHSGLSTILARLFGLRHLILPLPPNADERWNMRLFKNSLERLDHADANMNVKEFEDLGGKRSIQIWYLDPRQMHEFRHGRLVLDWESGSRQN